jgi:hypothetical protein
VLQQLLTPQDPLIMTPAASTHLAHLPQPTQLLLGMASLWSSSSRACCRGLGSTMLQMWGRLGLRLAWLGKLGMTSGDRRRQHGSLHQETTTREWSASAVSVLLSNTLWGLGSTMWQMWGVLGLLSARLVGLEMTGSGKRRQHGSPHQETTTRECTHNMSGLICVECT